jgi:hypothetical protein
VERSGFKKWDPAGRMSKTLRAWRRGSQLVVGGLSGEEEVGAGSESHSLDQRLSRKSRTAVKGVGSRMQDLRATCLVF